MKKFKWIAAVFGMVLFANCSDAQNKKDMDGKHSNNPYYSRTDTAHLDVNDAEWKKILPKEVYNIAR